MGKVQRKCALLLSAFMAVTPTLAQAHSDAKGKYTVLGPGNSSCGTWTEDRKEHDLLAIEDASWVQGFISGYNLFGPGSGNVTASTDSDGTMAWIDNYCVSHPLDSLDAATQNLIFELKSRRQ